MDLENMKQLQEMDSENMKQLQEAIAKDIEEAINSSKLDDYSVKNNLEKPLQLYLEQIRNKKFKNAEELRNYLQENLGDKVKLRRTCYSYGNGTRFCYP